MPKIGGAFTGGECVEKFSDPFPCCFDRSLFSLPNQPFELGEHHFDGVEVGTVGWQEEHVSSDATNGLANGFPLVAAEVVENDDIALRQGWHEGLLNPSGEGYPVNSHPIVTPFSRPELALTQF